jgi:hypothetical protein
MLTLASLAWASPQTDSEGPASAGARMRARKGFGAKKGPGANFRNRMEALERMTPEEQERFLNSLPAQRRAEAQRILAKWREMSPQERARARQTLGAFQQLAPERQRRIRAFYLQFNALPAERQPMLRAELRRLRMMDRTGSQIRISSKAFRDRYTAAEQQLLADLSEALPRQGYDDENDQEEQRPD